MLERELKNAQKVLAEQMSLAQNLGTIKLYQAKMQASQKEVQELKDAIEEMHKDLDVQECLNKQSKERLREEMVVTIEGLQHEFDQEVNTLKVNLAAANSERDRLTESLNRQRAEAHNLMLSFGMSGARQEGSAKRKYQRLSVEATEK